MRSHFKHLSIEYTLLPLSQLNCTQMVWEDDYMVHRAMPFSQFCSPFSHLLDDWMTQQYPVLASEEKSIVLLNNNVERMLVPTIQQKYFFL